MTSDIPMEGDIQFNMHDMSDSGTKEGRADKTEPRSLKKEKLPVLTVILDIKAMDSVAKCHEVRKAMRLEPWNNDIELKDLQRGIALAAVCGVGGFDWCRSRFLQENKYVRAEYFGFPISPFDISVFDLNVNIVGYPAASIRSRCTKRRAEEEPILTDSKKSRSTGVSCTDLPGELGSDNGGEAIDENNATSNDLEEKLSRVRSVMNISSALLRDQWQSVKKAKSLAGSVSQVEQRVDVLQSSLENQALSLEEKVKSIVAETRKDLQDRLVQVEKSLDLFQSKLEMLENAANYKASEQTMSSSARQSGHELPEHCY